MPRAWERIRENFSISPKGCAQLECESQSRISLRYWLRGFSLLIQTVNVKKYLLNREPVNIQGTKIKSNILRGHHHEKPNSYQNPR